jgi:hypothetical protein
VSRTDCDGGSRLPLKRVFWVCIFLLASLAFARLSVADELLRVDGQPVKWAPAEPGLATIITYATLKRPFTLPVSNETLSPDNCGDLRAFDEIVETSTSLTAAAAKRELISAFASWEKVAGITFIEMDDTEHANIIVGAIVTSNGPAFANLTLEAGHRSQPTVKAFGIGGGNLAVSADSGAQFEAVATIKQAYVCLNPQQSWKVGFDSNLSTFDLRHVFMHEIGHAIGLDHPGSSGAIMGYRYNEQVRELQPTDIAAARLHYGAARAENNDSMAPPSKP